MMLATMISDPTEPARALWERMNARDWDGVARLLDGGFSAVWPQTGERIPTPAAYVGLNQAYPGVWKIKVQSVDPSPDDLPILEPEPVARYAETLEPESQVPLAEGGDAPWHPTADLVARLWAEREHGGQIEVHHADGVIVPNWYDVTWSRGTHGVFGSQAPDGTVTITAVAWSSVQKVIVRQVQTLPADIFLTG